MRDTGAPRSHGRRIATGGRRTTARGYRRSASERAVVARTSTATRSRRSFVISRSEGRGAAPPHTAPSTAPTKPLPCLYRQELIEDGLLLRAQEVPHEPQWSPRTDDKLNTVEQD